MISDDDPKPTYGIGSVARLTGVRVESLRAWERRYGLVMPQRTASKQRMYTHGDVVRLQLIKQLVDRGDAVGTIAALSERELRERLQQFGERVAEIGPAVLPQRMLVYGDALPYLIESWRSQLEPLEVLGTYVRYGEFEAHAVEQRPDILVLEQPVLLPETVGRVRELRLRSGAAKIIVVYGFAAQPVVDHLREEAVQVLRAPVAVDALKLVCHVYNGVAGSSRQQPADVAEDAVRPRRYDDRQLAAVATAATGIRCECPHHLVDLIFRLNAFADYSAECENRSERDAALHANLFRTASKARAWLEDALDVLIQYEEIAVTPVRRDV